MTINELVETALKEDMPSGDLTTESLGLGPRQGPAYLVAKEDIVLSGNAVFEQAILMLEPSCRLNWHFQEGDLVLKDQTICSLHGDLIQILKAERVALNFLGRLTGIATLTRCFVKKVEGTQAIILDTRKTTPAYRELEKKAVRHGGGQNHRLNLSDAVLIKENHITVAGGMSEAVRRVRQHTTFPIEIEARTLDDVKEAIKLKVGRILLDNMSLELMKEALLLMPEDIESEASGNMTLDRVTDVAQLGLNYISVGALTHSAPCADVSLLFDWERATT